MTDQKHQHFVTSGAIFASRNPAFKDVPAAIAIFVTRTTGVLALQVDRNLNVQRRTTLGLLNKLRKAMAAE